MAEAARKGGRRISFSSMPATVVVTETSSSEISPELRAKAESTFQAASDSVLTLKEVPALLESLSYAPQAVRDFMQRQKVVPTAQPSISQNDFVALAAAMEEFNQEVGARSAAASRTLTNGLTESLQGKLKKFFDSIDKDSSGSVTLDEAINFWGKNFAKVNATAMFKEVDSDGDGSITFDEWIGFWVNVVAHGYAPDELEEEVEMLLEGNSWVDFNDGRNTGADAGQ
ncbi:hypothetical protein AB1Y20_017404 [Prymnesium parvum]|uniref:EF-hand domain-containing protein n=1 Tax=Prymnesium parvum TaxID=97485 RepID=A0AB34JP99_PRYPA